MSKPLLSISRAKCKQPAAQHLLYECADENQQLQKACFRKTASPPSSPWALIRRFIEVHVQTPLQECVQRDSKGLYARAYDGTAPGLPGVAEQYEAPLNPEIVAAGGFDDSAVERVLAALA